MGTLTHLQVLTMAAATALPPLSAAEMTKVREAFDKFDEDKSGAIDMWELRKVLQSMGQCPSEEDLLQMIMEVDEDGSGQVRRLPARRPTIGLLRLASVS